MNLKNIFVFIYRMFYSKISPNGYAKSLGVKMGVNVNFYGMKPGMFSTEPWLITLGDNVYITADNQFITHDGGTLICRKDIPDLEITKPIVVGSDVYIGVRCIIMPGVHIGNRVIIGAGSIVTKDIPDNSVAVGVPARVVKSVDEYIKKASEDSLHIGNLGPMEKERNLKQIFGIK